MILMNQSLNCTRFALQSTVMVYVTIPVSTITVSCTLNSEVQLKICMARTGCN
uniref:Uncharacterized protein n=1 Tax=Arundo donax TaxID=35708 RepID=A0A0A9D3J8_ARUDO